MAQIIELPNPFAYIEIDKEKETVRVVDKPSEKTYAVWNGYQIAESLEKESCRYKQALKNISEGNYPHPRTYRHKESSAGYGMCPHGNYYYEECGCCVDDYITSVLESPQPIVTQPESNLPISGLGGYDQVLRDEFEDGKK